MMTLAISRAHWLLIAISRSVRPASCFLPPTWATVEKAFADHDRLRLYYELGGDFAGIDADAIVEDFKIGMQHLTRWERAAVVTEVQWIAHATSLFSFLMPGAMKVFPTKNADQARSWIVSPPL